MKGVILALVGAVALSGCANPIVQQAVADGQLFCAVANGATVALQTTAGTPILAKGNTAAYVAAACALVNAIPVSPPASPATAPVVTVPATVAPAAAPNPPVTTNN